LVEITLRFEITPKTAKIELDGVPVKARQIAVRKDDAPHRLRITAPGFATYEEEVRFDESQRLVVPLKRATTRPTHPGQGSSRTERIDSQSPYSQ
jgi:hypothetical protein